MMNCREAAKAMSSGEGSGWWRRVNLKFHLMMCAPCSAFERQMTALKLGMKNLVSKKSGSAAVDIKKLEDEVIRKLREKNR